MNIKNTIYVVITPVKNEEKYLDITINSMINQTILPKLWIIVDDGSTDKTNLIATATAAKYPWIKVITNDHISKRAPGGNVISAFNLGLKRIDCDYEYIVKFDGDLKFDNDYFERLLTKFADNKNLGIAGGYCANIVNSSLVIDKSPEYHVRGATKMYRKRCFEEIGGLIPAMGWDGIDELKAMMLGWQTRSYPEIILIHLRTTGSGTGRISYAWKWGKSMHFMGFYPLYAILGSIKRTTEKPYFLFGISMLMGFIYQSMKNGQTVEDRELKIFIKTFQKKRLTDFVS